MVETTAHLQNQVLPHLSALKRLHYFVQRDRGALNMVLQIFLQAISQSLFANCCPGAAEDVEKAALRIGAIAFIHRFDHKLKGNEYFHVVQWMGCLMKWRATTGLPGGGFS